MNTKPQAAAERCADILSGRPKVSYDSIREVVTREYAPFIEAAEACIDEGNWMREEHVARFRAELARVKGNGGKIS